MLVQAFSFRRHESSSRATQDFQTVGDDVERRFPLTPAHDHEEQDSHDADEDSVEGLTRGPLGPAPVGRLSADHAERDRRAL